MIYTYIYIQLENWLDQFLLTNLCCRNTKLYRWLLYLLGWLALSWWSQPSHFGSTYVNIIRVFGAPNISIAKWSGVLTCLDQLWSPTEIDATAASAIGCSLMAAGCPLHQTETEWPNILQDTRYYKYIQWIYSIYTARISTPTKTKVDLIPVGLQSVDISFTIEVSRVSMKPMPRRDIG